MRIALRSRCAALLLLPFPVVAVASDPLAALPPVPILESNPQSPAKIELGKMLFFDPRLSGDATTSCATCHDPQRGWGDGNELSIGYPGTVHWRNSQTVVNTQYCSDKPVRPEPIKGKSL